jgi:hypothetical protein
MNHYEEELQKRIEAGLHEGDELDVKSYQEVFRVLKKEHSIELPSNFASRVITLVEAKQKKSASHDFFWFGVGIFFMVVCFVVAVAMTKVKFEMGFLKEMSGYTGLLVFGVAFITALNFLEKRLLSQQKAE